MKKIMLTLATLFAVSSISLTTVNAESVSGNQGIKANVLPGEDLDSSNNPKDEPKNENVNVNQETPVTKQKSDVPFLETGAGQSAIFILGGMGAISLGSYLVFSTKRDNKNKELSVN